MRIGVEGLKRLLARPKCQMCNKLSTESRRDSSLIARHEMPGCGSTIIARTPTGFNRTEVENMRV